MGFPDAGRPQQEQAVAVTDPAAQRQLAQLVGIERRLRLEIEAVQGAGERELGQRVAISKRRCSRRATSAWHRKVSASRRFRSRRAASSSRVSSRSPSAASCRRASSVGRASSNGFTNHLRDRLVLAKGRSSAGAGGAVAATAGLAPTGHRPLRQMGRIDHPLAPAGTDRGPATSSPPRVTAGPRRRSARSRSRRSAATARCSGGCPPPRSHRHALGGQFAGPAERRATVQGTQGGRFPR